MAKSKTSIFFCKECGNETSKWSGQCPACKAWNTLVEEPVTKMVKTSSAMGMFREPVKLEEIVLENESRMETGFGELDRVLGGGIVPGSLVLVGGDPGIGKSTLLLQVCRNLAIGQKKVLLDRLRCVLSELER